MLIVIPTHKRNHCVRWVLQSLSKNNFDGITDPIRILVVNNDPGSRLQIESIVTDFARTSTLDINILRRERTLPPVENWFSAIFDNSEEGEIVFINADDDLLYPWSISSRAKVMAQHRSDMVLGRIDHGLMFLNQAESASFPKPLSQPSSFDSQSLRLQDIWPFSAQHLSNHCYRSTPLVRRSLERALSWCHVLPWMDPYHRLLYVTLFLPMAVLLEGGKVAGLNQSVLLRGRDYEEIQSAPFGVPSWNHGYAALCALAIMRHSELSTIPELDEVRRDFESESVRWLATLPFDNRVPKKSILKTLIAAGIEGRRLFNSRLLFGVRLVLGEKLHLRGRQFSAGLNAGARPTRDLLEDIGAITQGRS